MNQVKRMLAAVVASLIHGDRLGLGPNGFFDLGDPYRAVNLFVKIDGSDVLETHSRSQPSDLATHLTDYGSDHQAMANGAFGRTILTD